MKEFATGALGMLVLVGSVWFFGTWVATIVSSHEVIEPEQGVRCVVVSRMFNTSVDCWEVK